MKGYIRCQANAFGDFASYEINSKSIFEIMSKFNEFEVIPNVMDEFRIEIKNNIPSQKLAKRLQLISSKNKLVVNFFQNNITVETQPQMDMEDEVAEKIIEDFITDAKKILAISLGIVGKRSNRISLVTTYLDESNVNNQYVKYVKPDSFFEGKEVFEWNIRSAVREELDISGKNEILNIISTISRTKGIIGNNLPTPTNNQFDGVLNEIDINTIPENNTDRIDGDFVNSFYDYAILKKKEIERMMCCDE